MSSIEGPGQCQEHQLRRLSSQPPRTWEHGSVLVNGVSGMLEQGHMSSNGPKEQLKRHRKDAPQDFHDEGVSEAQVHDSRHAKAKHRPISKTEGKKSEHAGR